MIADTYSPLEGMLMFVIYMVVGYGALRSLMVAWFYSNLPIHLFNFLFKEDKLYTRDELSVAMTVKFPEWIAELLDCPTCLSFHVALWCSVLVVLLFGLPNWYVPLSVLYWPGQYWSESKGKSLLSLIPKIGKKNG